MTLEWCDSFELDLFEKVVENLGKYPAIEEFTALIVRIDHEIARLKKERLQLHPYKKDPQRSYRSLEEKKWNFQKKRLIFNMAEFLRENIRKKKFKHWCTFEEAFYARFANYLVREKICTNYDKRPDNYITSKNEINFFAILYRVVCSIFYLKPLSFNKLTTFILTHSSLKYSRSTLLCLFDENQQEYQELKKLIFDFIVKNLC